MLNLITSPWIPIARLSGATGSVRPSDLTSDLSSDPIIALGFGRPDLGAAVTEFLIGLHAVAMPVEDVRHWHARWREPPQADEVAEAMALLAFAFELMGDGPRCFQDVDALTDVKPVQVQQLFIDAPGVNTAKLNQDLFVRRRGAEHRLAWAMAAAAVIALQTYAPSGGAGHRTSMRGGGPLTTLVRPRPEVDDRPVPLWRMIHANQPIGLGAPPLDARLFPWLAPTRTSEKGEVTTKEHAHPLQAFVGTPRRIRLTGDEAGCTGYRTVARGVNYAGWEHPLSPYYQQKEEWLPLHPREGVPTYRDWPGMWGGEARRAAACVRGWRKITDKTWIDADLIAFGYDMDNAKARAWQETRPALVLDEEQRDAANLMVAAAEQAGAALRLAAKRGLYGQARETDRGVDLYLPDMVPKRACVELVAELELKTEHRLVGLVRFLKDKGQKERDAVFCAWHTELREETLVLFDRTVSIKAVAANDLARIVETRTKLSGAFAPKGVVAKAMGITVKLEALGKERKAA